MSRRTERIASVIRKVVATAIRTRLSDPRLEPLTSVTRVEVSQDLEHARIYISVMAPDARQKLTLEALRQASGRVRGFLAEELTMRVLPQVTFRLDESIRQSAETIEAIDRVMREMNERDAARAENEVEIEGESRADDDDDGRGDDESLLQADDESSTSGDDLDAPQQSTHGRREDQ